ncbi:MAG: M18 family aminopeptidase [Desulfobulbaceae bacterium]|nr:M18 family aminopeptidase [Desulfobulbaceae bacterium]
MQNTSSLDRLLDFLGQSPTPYHAVAYLSKLLDANGFQKLEESGPWSTLKPGKYFIVRQDGGLIAFTLTDDPLDQTGLRLAGAHTDSPCLKVKPQPAKRKINYLQLGVEVYGGALLGPWFDRDLSLAGRVSWSEENGGFSKALINFQYPLAVIPSLAIHLDREANKKKSINKQTDLVPLLQLTDVDESFEGLLIEQIEKEHPQARPQQILGHDLFFFDVQKPARIGLHGDFITGARLDNLLSCFTLIHALIHSPEPQNSLVILNDHEEVGSVSTAGAQGPFLKHLLKRLVPESERRQQMLCRSLLISTDNAHGVHPNYGDKHDPEHLPTLNNGPVIKWNANQRYATDAVTGGFFRALCRRTGVEAQDFVMRNDMACGSTTGPLTAAEIGVRTVDVGVPSLAMHSIRETTGSSDYSALQEALQLFFALAPKDPLWTGLNQ